MLREAEADALRQLDVLLGAPADALVLLLVQRLAPEAGDAVGEALLDEVVVHLQRVLHLHGLQAPHEFGLLVLRDVLERVHRGHRAAARAAERRVEARTAARTARRGGCGGGLDSGAQFMRARCSL
mmetsp:Transcript_5472/g.17378  ORF Transcript_5472/g.17378 Transcript_5472/m.17378 type:complete len:126 (+) Transcript_5472:597-974(+)